MADTKVSAMTNASALAGGEEFHVVQSTNDRAASIDQVKTYVTTTPLAVVGNATAGAELRLPEDTDNGSNYVAIKAPDSLSATYTLTLPADDGSADQYLKTDGSGGLSWATVSGASAPLTLASGTITDPSAALTITQTWNDGADTFTAMSVNVTNTASATASQLLNMQVGGSTVFAVRRDGFLSIGGSDPTNGAGIGFQSAGDNLLTLYGGGSGSTAKVIIGGGSYPFTRLSSNGAYGWSAASNPTDAVNDTNFFRSAAGVVSVRGTSTSVGGALNFLEQTAPSAPSADQVVVYAEDNGSGKTRLMARFNTGAAQVLATEP